MGTGNHVNTQHIYWQCGNQAEVITIIVTQYMQFVVREIQYFDTWYTIIDNPGQTTLNNNSAH